jgi:hypothetical protein
MTTESRDLLQILIMVGIFALIAIHAICCNPYAAAWRTTAAVQSAGLETDKALARAARAKQTECLKACQPRTKCFAGCYGSTRGALKTWREKVRPSVNSALIATVGAIQTAEQAKKKLDWMKVLMPAVCALAGAVDQFSHLMGSSGAKIKSLLGLAKAVTCGR